MRKVHLENEKATSLKHRGKICTRTLLDMIVVGFIGYRTFGRALVYLVDRQQAIKIEGATPPLPPLCHC